MLTPSFSLVPITAILNQNDKNKKLGCTPCDLLDVHHNRKDVHPQLIGDVRHAGQHAGLHLGTVARQELEHTFVANIIGRVQVESDQTARCTTVHPGTEHRVVESVVLSGRQEAV